MYKIYIFISIMCSSLCNSVVADQITFLKQFIRPGDLVFDVGANYGEKTEQYIKCGAQVVCFEPQHECIDVLRRKYGYGEGVAIEHMGLASKEGVLEFYRCSAGNSISSFSKDWIKNSRFAPKHVWDNSFLIAVSTLDIMIKKYGIPQFCKIDVEGFEDEVITGLSRSIPSMSFEVNCEMLHQTKRCIEHLATLGNPRFNFVVADRAKWHFTEWYPADVFFTKLLAESKKNWSSRIVGGLLWGDVYVIFDNV